jgi:UDP-N-acetylglucosamine 2-epimerase (non-hydrolysing)
MYRLICVVGARPNFMKIAPIIDALKSETDIQVTLVHTGQHYDDNMKQQFFVQLGIPEPDIDLGVGSGTHSIQTAQIMMHFEPVLEKYSAQAVLVVGDVNSTIACALVAVKNHIPVIHVEAGLRSGDRQMPEEINRILTDQLSDLLYTTERNAESNLNREGIPSNRIRFVGNVMIDTLKKHVTKAAPVAETLSGFANAEALAKIEAGYALLTMHRPSNVDDKETLTRLLDTLSQISKRLPIIFPLHPRTAEKIKEFGLQNKIDEADITVLPPQGYMQILGLMANAKLVLTDSGGIQEETTALGVPCVTLRENTERPITVDQGTNTIVGSDPVAILAAVEDVISNGGKHGRQPELWDGQAAVRIARDLSSWFDQQPQT